MNIGNFRRRRRGFTLIELMIVIAIIAILASILTPSFIRVRAMTQLTACKSNLKNLATSLEAYGVDHAGRYPNDLTNLTPNYLKTLPLCPAAATNTYVYVPTVVPDDFNIRCDGNTHQSLAVPINYPQWDAGSGLAER